MQKLQMNLEHEEVMMIRDALHHLISTLLIETPYDEVVKLLAIELWEKFAEKAAVVRPWNTRLVRSKVKTLHVAMIEYSVANNTSQYQASRFGAWGREIDQFLKQ